MASAASGSSEIGSISFGLTANPTQAVSAIKTVEQQAAKTADKLEATGKRIAQQVTAPTERATAEVAATIGSTGEETGSQYSGGLLKSLRGARTGLHHAIGGLLAVPATSKIAYDLGQEIRGWIIEGLKGPSGRGREAGEGFVTQLLLGEGSSQQRLDALRQQISKLNADIAGTLENTDDVSIYGASASKTVREIEAQKAVLEHQASIEQRFVDQQRNKVRALEQEKKLLQEIEDARTQGAEAAARFREIEAEDNRRSLDEQKKFVDGYRMMDSAVSDYREEQARANEEGAKMGEGLVDAFREFVSLSQEMQRRQESVRSTLLDNTPIDISRIRSLMEITRRQPLPPIPGSGMQ